jgi:hypothetical protein
MATTYMRASSGEVFTTENPEWHKDCEKLTAKAGKLARRDYARDTIRAMVKPGQTVHCVLRSVSSSGMSRRISLCIVQGDSLRNIDALAADAAGFKLSDKGGIVATGCGMDMGFHLVYNLGCALWPNGTPEPHGMRNGQPDTAGGYALRQDWA